MRWNGSAKGSKINQVSNYRTFRNITINSPELISGMPEIDINKSAICCKSQPMRVTLDRFLY